MSSNQLKRSSYVLKPSEVKKVIFATNSFRDRCLIKGLYYAGLRRFEVISLDVRDIHWAINQLVVREGKGDKTRVIPLLDQEFKGDLQHLIGKRVEGPVFMTSQGKGLSLRLVNYVVCRAAEAAEVKHPNPSMKHVNPHLFRHSISRHLKDKGYSGEFIQNFLGHNSIKTTMDMYGTMTIDDMQGQVEKHQGLTG